MSITRNVVTEINGASPQENLSSGFPTKQVSNQTP